LSNKVKDHFENEAHEFDSIILKLIPHYPSMVRALAAVLPFEKSAPLRIIDLGCGTGTVSAQIMEAFPNAQITCLDLSENMIAMARAKLARYPLVNYIVSDFESYDFSGGYDAVVSSLALHHIADDEAKKRIYRRICDSLNPRGVFYNADVVLASNEFLQNIYLNEWRAFMRRSISSEEIEGKWIPKHQEEDHPAKLTNHLAWMTEIGFADVDVIWKYYNFAVFGGSKK
jgi:tRNA (cmo5U34)-methyltransferase